MPLDNVIANILASNGSLPTKSPYTPKEFKGRQKQYYADTTAKFTQHYAKYSDEYISAEVQGVNPAKNKFEYTQQYIRMADATSLSALTGKAVDDYKTVMFANPQIRFISHGTKIKAMGSTWLVVDGANIARAQPEVVAARCQATIGYYDYYLNPKYEPVHLSNALMASASPDVQLQFRMMTGYVRVTMQKNRVTEQLSENSRIILGSSAYLISGYSDYMREFTDNEDSVDIVEFYARVTEVNSVLDDMELKIAGGRAHSWHIGIGGADKLRVGGSVQLTAESMKDGAEIEPTDEFPITYSFTSSDYSVAQVTNLGLVQGVSAGTAVITCTLDQNPNIKAEVLITVEQAVSGTSVEFAGTVPKTLKAFAETTLEAVVYENGTATANIPTWEVGGAAAGTYRYAVSNDGAVTITAYGYSKASLTVRASYGGASATAEIQLLN